MDTEEPLQSTEGSLKKKYEIIEKISEGQFGTVFRAINKENNEIVAVKKLYVSAKANSQASNHVLREIKLMRKINHENTLKLLDYKIKETSIKLVFEYMDYDLKNFIEHMPTPLKNSKVKGIAKMILNGLNAIHEQGIIHRDLKPSNILINSSGLIKIGDFGSAISIDDTQNGQFEIEGFSRWYKSPEMLYGSRTYDYKTDIWSFACIFGELLNGSPLFPGNNDFDQLSRIIRTLGSPTPENWKELESLPDYGKVVFHQHNPVPFEKIFPNATISELNFIKSILCFERPKSVKEILNHPYFTENPKPSTFKLVSIKKEGLEARANYQALFKF